VGIIWLHVITACGAVLLGGYNLWAEKGTAHHKFIGRFWILLMGITAMVSFEITELQPSRYSWIHLLSAWTLLSLGIALWAARTGRIITHKRFMIGTYVGAFIAGAFALAPGRFLSHVFGYS